MNTRIVLIAAALLLLLSAHGIAAQDEPWDISFYNPSDLEFLQNDLASKLDGGLYPVGIEVDQAGVISVLYQRTGDASRTFNLHFFDDLQQLNSSFSYFLSQGWVPADIAFSGDGMYALFVQNGVEVESWRLVTISADGETDQQQAILDSVKVMAENNLVPFGLSRHQGNLIIGFASPHRSAHVTIGGDYVIDAYPNDGESLITGITSRTLAGMSIAGYHFDGERIFVAYLQ